MARWRKRDESYAPMGDRTWSTPANTEPASASSELVTRSALPAETGPTWAPDRLSVWPVEGGRYGIDAHYHGHTGRARASHQQARLRSQGLTASVRNDDAGGVLRLGPLTHGAVWLALEAFLGRPLAFEDD